MNESAQETALHAFCQIVKPYLRKRFGWKIATMLAEAVQTKTLPDTISPDDAFAMMYKELLDVQLDGYTGPFLGLILEKGELNSLPESFERDYTSLYGNNRSSVTVKNVFMLLLAPDLTDVLGEELVTFLNKLYIDSIELQVGVADHIRFCEAMKQLMETVSLLNEAEYLEKIKKIAADLKENQNRTSASTRQKSSSSVSLQDGIDNIISPDLANILGNGPVLKSLIHSTYKKCSGFFPDELARFSSFVRELNKSDIILNMYGDHWTTGKEHQWIEDFKKMMYA